MRRDVLVSGITLIVFGVLIFAVSSLISNNVEQCNGQILLVSITCGTMAPLLVVVTVLAIAMVIIGITLAIIAPLAPSKAAR